MTSLTYLVPSNLLFCAPRRKISYNQLNVDFIAYNAALSEPRTPLNISASLITSNTSGAVLPNASNHDDPDTALKTNRCIHTEVTDAAPSSSSSASRPLTEVSAMINIFVLKSYL